LIKGFYKVTKLSVLFLRGLNEREDVVTLTSIVVDSLTINGHVQPSDVLSRIVNFHSADNFCASYVSEK